MMHLSEDTCPYICLGRCAQTTLHNTVTIKGHWWSHDISGDLSCDLLSRVGCYKSNTWSVRGQLEIGAELLSDDLLQSVFGDVAESSVQQGPIYSG